MKYLPYLYLVVFLFISCGEEEPIPTIRETYCTLNTSESLVAEELNSKYAYVFESDDPALEEDALTPLIDYLKEAKIVGLGEGTHGTREFFRMKDKIFRQLVKQGGFKAIVFEIPWGNAYRLNEYVIEGKLSADELVDQTYYWVYDTQEVRDLADWMYEHNLSTSDNKIFFVGCDPQGGDFEVEKEIVFQYLDRVIPDSATTVIATYASLPRDLMNYDDLSDASKEKNRLNTEAMYNYLESNRERFSAISGTFDFEVALMAAHVIQHREYIYRIQSFGTPRDSLMAVYSAWWQRILDQDAKVAVWAHNAHVMDSKPLGSHWMGRFLKEEFRDDYKNVAFTFGTGCLNAFRSTATGAPAGGVQKHTVSYAPCLTINNLLSQLEGDQNYIIFDDIPLGSYASEYFKSHQKLYQCGAGFNSAFISRYTQWTNLESLYDAVIHFDYTHESELR